MADLFVAYNAVLLIAWVTSTVSPASVFALPFSFSRLMLELLLLLVVGSTLLVFNSSRQIRRFSERLCARLAPPAKHFPNTTFGSVPQLVARQKRPTVLLNPVEAASRGLAEGTLARVFNACGRTKAYGVVTEDVAPGVAVVPSIWWSKHVPGGFGVNALTSRRLTDIGDSSAFHRAPVDVGSE